MNKKIWFDIDFLKLKKITLYKSILFALNIPYPSSESIKEREGGWERQLI